MTGVTGQDRPRVWAGTQLQKRLAGEETQTSLLSREEDRQTSVLVCRKFILHPVKSCRIFFVSFPRETKTEWTDGWKVQKF